MLAGAFRSVDAEVPLSAWECPICWTSNAVDNEAASPRCKVCQRLRSPLWLFVEQFELQIDLGSRVFHTSPGGSKLAAVIIAIDHAKKIVTLLTIRVKRAEYGDGAVGFQEIVLNELQVQEQLEPLDTEHEDGAMLDKYGICGDCRSTFCIKQGDHQNRFAIEDKIGAIRKEIAQLGEQKQRLLREKDYERVQKCTEETKFLVKHIQLSKRELELMNPIFCPFCGWVSSDKQRSRKDEG